MEQIEKYKSYYKIYDSIVLKMLPFYPEMHSVIINEIDKKENEVFYILDAGVGTGTLTQRIFEKYKEVDITGIDINDELLEKAQLKFTDNQKERFHKIIGNLSDLEIKGNFDYVVSALALHHLDDGEKEKYFKHIFTILKDGGKFIIGDLVLSDREEEWHKFLIETMGDEGEYRWQRHKNNKKDKPSRLEDQLFWLKKAGFKNIRVLKNWFHFYVFVGEK